MRLVGLGPSVGTRCLQILYAARAHVAAKARGCAGTLVGVAGVGRSGIGTIILGLKDVAPAWVSHVIPLPRVW